MRDERDRLEHMVTTQIEARGVRDPAVLRAMRTVPRELFVPESDRARAYDDGPLPIGAGQTISQPFIVASMIESLELKGSDTVLEVGVGSGYAAAVIARIAASVSGIERHEELARLARERFARLGYHNIEVRHGDGTTGWSERAPFDAIVVAAAGPVVPPSLRSQLADGGRLVMPVGRSVRDQQLVRIRRDGERFSEERLEPVRFVPLVGAEGWPDETEG